MFAEQSLEKNKLSHRHSGKELGLRKFLTKTFRSRAGALVKWLWEETHVQKVMGSNPDTVYWMDIFSHLCVVKIVMMFV